MRHNNYVNDIGDFYKYALLNIVGGLDNCRLGVLWYLTEHAESNNDGRKQHHLGAGDWHLLDPSLLEALVRLEAARASHDGMDYLRLVETMGVLPATTVFASEPVPVVTGADSGARREWFQRAMAQPSSPRAM